MKNLMKPFSFLALLFSVVFISSCSDDDDIAKITIETVLENSKQAYQNASDGDWISVTEEEYNNLILELNDVSKVGTTDALYNATEGNSNTNSWTIINDIGASVPENSYVFAFKYYINTGTDITGFKIKQSETIDDSYTDLGGALPIHSGTEENVYFVLKGNSNKLNTEGYVGFHKPSGPSIGFTSSASENYYFADNDVNTGFSFFNGYVHYQALSTTQKQW